MTKIISCYDDQRVALLTQHGKELLVAPVLETALGCQVERVTGYDTDLLGTFTRETPRAGSQIEAARKKARIGMQLSGLPLGLASEGAFGIDPYTQMLPWNMEMLLFIDDEHDIEVVGVADGKACFSHLLTTEWPKAEAFARQYQFPEHHLVLRPEGENDNRIRKGIVRWTELRAAFSQAQQQAASDQVFLETDVRAYANPTRQETIRLAAADLAKKLRSLCPACGIPGFWLIEREPGLPCEDCGAPTREIRAEIHGCLKCTHRLSNDFPESQYADSSRCDNCNP